MNIYCVGGAVRDQLLGLDSHDSDWVVVGSTPEQLQELGYQPVGKDFPVFLHPESHEEYALARTERKTAHGYSGFTFHTSPDITLEQDLQRRDLTINAMARDGDGQLIDPYGGQQDLEQRLLRHVSPAFAEDPLRVLRTCRFAARLHRFGFSIATETMELMRQLSHPDELLALAPERVWQETRKALMSEHPEVYFEQLRACGALNILFPEINRLFGVPQPEKYHPEIDTGVHLMLCLQQSAKLQHDLETRICVLLHDLGKGITPAELLPSHHGHEQHGVPLVREFCQRLRLPKEQSRLARLNCEFHGHVHRALELKASTLLKLLQSLDVWRRPQTLDTITDACLADARGRPTHEDDPYPQKAFLQQLFSELKQIQARGLKQPGMSGTQIAEALNQARLQSTKAFRQSFLERR